MTELNIEKFNPTVAELTKLVDETKNITVTDLTDKKQLEVVKKNRIGLRDARVKIEKAGKELRADALTFQKAVIAKEKELIGIIWQEEERLKSIEIEAVKLAEMEIRKEQLPARMARLEEIGIVEAHDFILGMDSTTFEQFFNVQVNLKNEAERIEKQKEQDAKEVELRAREEAIKEAERKIEEENRAKEREEKARTDERKRIESEAIEKARKEAEAKEKLERANAYREYRLSLGWSEETRADWKEDSDGVQVVLYKKVGSFKL